MSITYTDPYKRCPDCSEKGRLSYVRIPKSQLTYMVKGETHTEHFAVTRDYTCGNCGCEFKLIKWEC